MHLDMPTEPIPVDNPTNLQINIKWVVIWGYLWWACSSIRKWSAPMILIVTLLKNCSPDPVNPSLTACSSSSICTYKELESIVVTYGVTTSIMLYFQWSHLSRQISKGLWLGILVMHPTTPEVRNQLDTWCYSYSLWFQMSECQAF